MDYHFTSQQARSLIHELRNHKNGHQFTLLQFEDRYTFIAHRQRLLEQCGRRHNTIYVDVQGPAPVELTQAPEDADQFLKDMCEALATGPEDWVATSVPCFMVTLTGWLLEYPVVYVSHQPNGPPLDEWEVRTNCLGQRPLVLIQLQAIDHLPVAPQAWPLLAFTYPQAILPDPQKQQQLLERTRAHFSSRMVSPFTLQAEQSLVSMDRIAL
ncbi:hypothetical protein DM01DRAFT_1343332 [Hesseltinella vesiculosa]|uniref:Uncharacterized protein n=1 Tax=Hesseltinella vesiculosa TaxID=101127 RepID=A0A1X2GRA5_9FUNG|nr:hypothetical protein DM01DRAFT_1343332 [Hesseltinella vesiculosa]